MTILTAFVYLFWKCQYNWRLICMYHSYWTSDACSNNSYMWFIKIKSLYLKLQEGQSWSNAHHECLLFIQQELAQARAKTSEKPTFWKLNTLEFIYCSSFSTHLIESTRNFRTNSELHLHFISLRSSWHK